MENRNYYELTNFYDADVDDSEVINYVDFLIRCVKIALLFFWKNAFHTAVYRRSKSAMKRLTIAWLEIVRRVCASKEIAKIGQYYRQKRKQFLLAQNADNLQKVYLCRVPTNIVW